MTKYRVADAFSHGEWSYRPSEEYSLDDLEERGMGGDAVAYWARRGNLERAEEPAVHDVPASEPDFPTALAPDEG